MNLNITNTSIVISTSIVIKTGKYKIIKSPKTAGNYPCSSYIPIKHRAKKHCSQNR